MEAQALQQQALLSLCEGKEVEWPSMFLFSLPDSDAKDRLLPIRSLFAPLRLKSWAGKEKGWSSVDEKKKVGASADGALYCHRTVILGTMAPQVLQPCCGPRIL